MEPEEIERHLIEALTEVRRLYDAGDDTWRLAVVNVWFKFANEIGVDKELLVPIMAMRLEETDRVIVTGRRKEGKLGTPKPVRQSTPLLFAAAAVTVLKKRDRMSVTDAVNAVARASKADAKQIKAFRDEINRAKVSEKVIRDYHDVVKQLGEWPTKAILRESMPILGAFVK